jgi:hypothetical protein
MADPENERDSRKRAILNQMSPRRQKYILNKVGFENWDPFQEPKDPIDIRKDKTHRTSKALFREFLHARKLEDYSNAYGEGVLEMCMGLVNEDDKARGMFEFSIWYQDLLKREGFEV